MNLQRLTFGLLATVTLASLAGCASDSDSEASTLAGAEPRGAGVGQAGAQDFGQFRGIVENGEIPAPNTLDAVGFFNEHKIELPPPDCGNEVCLHGLLGVRGNMLTGNNCTIAVVGFNTARTADEFERPPLNMAIAVDVSGSMAGDPIQFVRNGLTQLVTSLDPKDSVALITYSDDATLVVDSTPESDPSRQQLVEAIQALEALGSTNVYAGLRDAVDHVAARRDDGLQNRVILLSDGDATTGITDTDRILNLGASYAEDGVGITTIGVGQAFDVDLMRGLSEAGSGNFYFLEDPAAVEEVFTEEVKTFLVPLAQTVRIDFDVADGYAFRAAYGTRLWTGDADGATIDIPALFMASRESVDVEPGEGRRGGGGVIILEMTPTASTGQATSIGAGAAAGTLNMTYRTPGSNIDVDQSVTITNPLAPGETPEDGAFDSFAVEKSFVALNVFVGFQMALERAEAGSMNAALNVLIPLEEQLTAWVGLNPDPDIEDDLQTLRQLIENIDISAGRRPVGLPPEPWPIGD